MCRSNTDTNVMLNTCMRQYNKRDPQAWRVGRNGRASPSAPAAPIIKAEGSSRNSLVYSSGSSLGPGGRKLKTVDSGMNGIFDDDDDPSARRRREREYGEEGDLDEQVFEETFDDDEGVVEEEDEAAKELEVRPNCVKDCISNDPKRKD